MPDSSFTSAGGGSANDPFQNYYSGMGIGSLMNPNAIKPINGINGIQGYTGYGQGKPGQATQWPYANSQNTFGGSNYTGLLNSTYGSGNSPNYNPATNSYLAQTGGTPVWNGSAWVSSSTGQPFTGTYNGTSFNAGQSYQQMANDPTSRYQAVGISKDPGVLNKTNSLISSFQPTQGISNFSDLLDSARTGQAGATAGYASQRNAADLQPLTNTLNSLNTGYADTTSGLNTNYSDLLGGTAANENSILGTATNNLTQYDKAVTDVGNLAQNALGAQVSRYKLGSGTPMSLGGGEEAMLINGTNAIQVPLALDKIKAQQDLLLGTALPLATAQGNRQVQQLTGFTAPLARENYQNASSTATMLQNLAIQTAGMSVQQAAQYMQTMGIPDTQIQQVLAGNQSLQGGDISNLSGLNTLYGNTQYQGLQDKFGANLSQPTATTFSPGGAGAYPVGGSRYSGLYPNTSGTGTFGTQNQQPVNPYNGQQYQAGQQYQIGNSVLTATGNGYFTDGSGNYWNAQGQIVYSNPNPTPAANPYADSAGYENAPANDTLAGNYSTTPGGGGDYGGSGAGGTW